MVINKLDILKPLAGPYKASSPYEAQRNMGLKWHGSLVPRWIDFLGKQLIVFRMSAYPNLKKSARNLRGYCTIIRPHTGRQDFTHLFELKRT